MRAAWFVVIPFVVALLLLCVRTVETFDDKDVPAMFKSVRTSQDDADAEVEAEFDHESPDEDPEDHIELEHDISEYEGEIALALRQNQPELFETLAEWYVSDQAYDLEALEKELDIEDVPDDQP
jgi:hypothetical protein